MSKNKYKIEESTLVNFFGMNNYLIAKNFDLEKVELEISYNNVDYETFTYSIIDAENKYNVDISLYKSAVRRYHCTCSKFAKTKKCEHIVTGFLKSFEINNQNSKISMDSYYEHIVKTFFKEDKKTLIDLDIIFNFLDDGIQVKIKIGDEKKYSITSKFGSFYNYYTKQRGSLEVGRYFTYKPEEHKFTEKNETIIEYLYSISVNQKNYSNKMILLTNSQLLFLLKLLGDTPYSIENIKTKCIGYEEGFPYNLSLSEIDGKYNFKFDLNNMNFLMNNNTIALEKNKLYFLPPKMSNFITNLIDNSINEISVEKENAIGFSKAITPLVKENYIIDENLTDEFKIIVPKVEMFFDFNHSLEVKIIYKYNEKEINFYDKDEAFRNSKYEEIVQNDIIKYNFTKNKNKFILDDVNDIVDFLESGIFELRKKYIIFTSEKFENAQVFKARSIQSQFSIGKDNIMTYKFELDGIDSKELKNIFNNMDNNKKYYKLKSGKILDTDDKSIRELKEVCDNLDLDEYSEEGSIPKYRALYLDSIKDYSIVKTDNLFNNFIDNFNKYKDANIKLNPADKVILRDYQLDGIKWMFNVYKSGFAGILADEMGLGKTIQTIMFIKNVLEEKPNAKILIVAPTSLIYNWENEFNKFGIELKYKVIANNKEKRIKDLEENINVFITTYGLLRQDQEIYSKINFDLIIIDEAQNIKNPRAGISAALKSLKSTSKMALTGTPIENSVVEVWSIFDFLMPGYLNTLSTFQSKYNIKDMDEDAREKLNNLTKIITPFILRRKKKDVLFDLPDKFENNIYLDLLPEQKKYYAMQVKKSKEEFEKLVEEEGFLKARFKILQLLTKLRQLCIDPNLVYNNFDGESVKMVEIINLIQEYKKNGHKVLVFSTFKTALEILYQKLNENAISSYTINGGVKSKDRNDLVNAFNKDNTDVFLITLKAGGTGLNLTSADVVIHLDLWWNPQAENQATDRAHRIGQTNKVEVVKLICKGTIEEKIIELQDKKKILNDALIESDEVSDVMFSKLSEKDIKELFKLAD